MESQKANQQLLFVIFLNVNYFSICLNMKKSLQQQIVTTIWDMISLHKACLDRTPSWIHPSFMPLDHQVMLNITISINNAKHKHKIYFAPTWSSYLYNIDVDMINEYSLQCRCWNGDFVHVIINMLHIFIPFMYETPHCWHFWIQMFYVILQSSPLTFMTFFVYVFLTCLCRTSNITCTYLCSIWLYLINNCTTWPIWLSHSSDKHILSKSTIIHQCYCHIYI